MTSYSRKDRTGATSWRYDFVLGGKRYTSPKALASKRDADRAEAARRKAIARGVDEPESDGAEEAETLQRSTPMVAKRPTRGAAIVTLDQACERYWIDLGRQHRSASDIKRRLEHVRRIVGSDPRVVEKGVAGVNTAVVIAAVRARKAEETLTRHGARSGKLVSNAGANRDVIDQLRPVLNHAALVWEDDDLIIRPIKWKAARLKEGDEVVCEFSDAELDRWRDELRAGAAKHARDGAIEVAFLELALALGPRFGELHFPPDAFKADADEGPELELGRYIGKGGVRRASRKDGSLHSVPLLQEHVDLLEPLVDTAIAARAETIWLETTRAGATKRITYDAMRHRLVAAAARAGIAKGRIVHGLRHHAGTMMERAGGIARVQQLLGHKQITTSRRYAHAKKSELRRNMEDVAARRGGDKSRPIPTEAAPRSR